MSVQSFSQLAQDFQCSTPQQTWLALGPAARSHWDDKGDVSSVFAASSLRCEHGRLWHLPPWIDQDLARLPDAAAAERIRSSSLAAASSGGCCGGGGRGGVRGDRGGGNGCDRRDRGVGMCFACGLTPEPFFISVDIKGKGKIFCWHCSQAISEKYIENMDCMYPYAIEGYRYIEASEATKSAAKQAAMHVAP